MRKADGPGPHEVAAEVNKVEGYLLWQTECAQARTRAGDFTARLPWLTNAQREDVERVYIQDQLRYSREYLRRIAVRCGELRDEYRGVYRRLRRRLAAVFLAGSGLVGVLVSLLVHRR